ncbi:hypothetical protein THAOC_14236 [Thalassiosira oceanica]|uniref:Uncharacterized protein n=1 Tax=Thalassiosira oceanica TaxID=159749 RepID=K0SVD5_THAOC|nr:hypothetical protein THAOC_14236 [Thalassiosira oceanica]|eukprot:EJK64971.1 hypothetical protein THAOC_14236 [Thalassiosira oceanica]
MRTEVALQVKRPARSVAVPVLPPDPLGRPSTERGLPGRPLLLAAGGKGGREEGRRPAEALLRQRSLRSVSTQTSRGKAKGATNAHYFGEGVQQDTAKAVEYYERAAMQGHVLTRHNLGAMEGKKKNNDRAARHYLISAKVGQENSIKTMKMMFADGIATKEQYAKVLKGYQDAVEGMKSYDRDEAMSFMASQRPAK